MNPPDSAHPSTATELLREPLRELERHGIERPAATTLEQFLNHLVRHRLLTSPTVSAWLALYEETRYGERTPDLAVVREVSRRMTEELRRLDRLSDQERERIKTHLKDAAADDVAADSPPLPEVPAITPSHLVKELPPRPITGNRRLRAFAGLAVVWTALMIGVGYLQADRIDQWLFNSRLRLFGPESLNNADRVDWLYEQALREPENLRVWRQLGDLAQAQHAFEQAIVAYYYVIARDPGDAETRNNLAWLYCTAKDPRHRRPEDALRLAEEANRLSPGSLHILDTLAEATWLTGDAERAVALEERVVKAAGNRLESEFYRRQLAKFRRGPPETGKPAPAVD